MHSQNMEEQVLVEYFGDYVGRFLDIGAYDGIDSSNTARLVELGWSGVLVEAAPIYFDMLLKNCSGNSKLTLVNCALDTTDGFRKFHYTQRGGVSTLDDQSYENWKYIGDFRDYVVPTVSMGRFLSNFPGPYDLIDIDVNGIDADLIECVPLDDTRAVCIEYGRALERIRNHMTGAGFIEKYRCNENLIFVR